MIMIYYVHMKTNHLLAAVAVLAATVGFGASPKNIILFIGDGMSVPQRMTAEEFARNLGRGALAMNTMDRQVLARTRSATSVITDSAAAATAIACGEKTYNGAIGVGERKQRLESVAEVAHQAGKRVGIVTTVTICHATPAGFYAHRTSRGDSYGIGLDLIDSGFDYFAGGGFGGAEANDGDKKWKGNLYELAEKAGMEVITWKDPDAVAKFRALKPGGGKRILYSHSPDAMPFSIDAEPGDLTLAELTAKGLELLDNEKGFFLMVEGGKIDYAGHANDAATNLREVLALDEAVKVGLDFAKKDGNTLVIVTGDHETGGMSMGFANTGYALHLDRLALQTCSVGQFMDSRLRPARKAATDAGRKFTFEDVKPILRESFGFAFPKGTNACAAAQSDAKTGDKFAASTKATGKLIEIDAKGEKELNEAYKRGDLANAARWIVDARAGIGWSSGAHTALPAQTTLEGPGAELFRGYIENTDISKNLKELVK